MKLLVDGVVYGWRWRGGVRRIFDEVLPRLAAAGVEVVLVVPQSADLTGVAPAVQSGAFRVPSLPRSLKPWRLWSRWAPWIDGILARRFWRRLDGDVVLTTHYTYPPVRCPLICPAYDTIFELFPDSFEDRFRRSVMRAKRAALKAADLVLCISEQTRKDVVRWVGVESEKCRTIPLAPSVTESMFATRQPVQRERFLLYVGDFRTPYKNFTFLAHALAAQSGGGFSDYQLVVATSQAPSPLEAEQLFQVLPPSRLRFQAPCSDSELASLYAGCDALVCPSLYEGFGIPVLEAMSFGAPVVCSNAGALPEVGGELAYYFDPRDADSFRKALIRALADGRRSDLANKRRAWAGQFSWDRTAAAYLNACREAMVMGRGRARSGRTTQE